MTAGPRQRIVAQRQSAAATRREGFFEDFRGGRTTARMHCGDPSFLVPSHPATLQSAAAKFRASIEAEMPLRSAWPLHFGPRSAVI